MSAREPSLEVKAVIAEFCRINREKYGPDWKRIVAKQMSDAAAPYVEAILKIGKHGRPS